MVADPDLSDHLICEYEMLASKSPWLQPPLVISSTSARPQEGSQYHICPSLFNWLEEGSKSPVCLKYSEKFTIFFAVIIQNNGVHISSFLTGTPGGCLVFGAYY